MFFVIVGVELQMICPGVGSQDVDQFQYTDQERAESSPEAVYARKWSKNQNSNDEGKTKLKKQKGLREVHFDF